MPTATRFALFIALALSTGPTSTSAQFRVSGFSPVDGATNVPLEATIRFTFSEPVDTSATWPPEVPDFFLDLKVTPDPWDGFAGVDLDPEFRWIDMFLTLQPNTQYWWVVRRGQGLSGSTMAGPFTATFSTGSALTMGRISGSIPGAGPETVLAIDNPHRLFSEDPGPGVPAVDAAGLFTIVGIPDGDYLLGVFPDRNGDHSPDPGGLFGMYDPNHDYVADTLRIRNGASLTGINVVMEPFTGRRASHGHSAAPGMIASTVPDARPISIATDDVMADGTSLLWFHEWQSSSGPASTTIVSLGPWLINLGSAAGGGEALPQTFIDSDEAVSVSESSGGSAVRAPQDQGHVNARLTVRTRREGDPAESARPMWSFEYFGAGASATFLVDASTGLLVGTQRHDRSLPLATRMDAPYPNPAVNQATVALRVSNQTGTTVQLFDVLGRSLATYQLEVGKHVLRLDTGVLAPGVYIVRESSGAAESFVVIQQ